MPLAEVVTDYFDQLKSRSKGYASMEYKLTGYRPNDLVLLEVIAFEGGGCFVCACVCVFG
jgi:GTP-binding protein LepA